MNSEFLWCIWVDEEKKLITSQKKSLFSRQRFYRNKDYALRELSELVAKGYKLG